MAEHGMRFLLTKFFAGVGNKKIIIIFSVSSLSMHSRQTPAGNGWLISLQASERC